MRIGVDAGALSITDERLRVGVWRVTYNLLKELPKIDKKNEYRLYTFLPIDRGVMADFGPRMKNVIVRPRIGWARLQLPIELRRHPVDLFLGLSQMLPRPLRLSVSFGGQAYSPSRTIGFIYDLGFLRYPEAYPGSLKKLENQTKQLIKRSDHIIAISRITKADIIDKYHVKSSQVIVAYPGIDSRFVPRGSKHKEKNPYILFVGALKRGKDVPFAIRVFKKFLEKSKKNYDFILVGGNYWEDPEIAKTIRKERLNHNVKIKGFVSDKDLPTYYRGADALFITSLWEGFCLPAVEAMACGCPVVYRKSGSLPEIVGSAGCPFVTETEGVAALIGKKSGTAGLARSKEFSWTRFAKTVYQLL